MAVGAVVSVFLTGCGGQSTGEVSDPPKPSASVTEPAATEPEPPAEPAAAVPAVGATGITSEEAEAAKAAGLGVYQFGDGTLVVVDPHLPFPADLVVDMRDTAGNMGIAPSWDERDAYFKRLTGPWERAAGSGKYPVFVFASGTYDPSAKSLVESFVNIKSLDPDRALNGVMFASADEAIAGAQSIIATKPDPSLYEVIDLTR